MLLTVERERVITAALVHPERVVEPIAQLFRIALEALGQVAVAPDLTGELRHAPLRVVHVTLHFARCDGRDRLPPVMEALRVARVLPGLIFEPARRSALVFDEAVAVTIAELVDPAQGGERGLPELERKRAVVRPPPRLREQDQEQGRCIGGPVVAVEPVVGALAAAHFVHDLPRLGVAGRVVGRRLESGELA